MSETFDLTAFIDGSSYPQKTVTVYTNVAALTKAQELDERINDTVTSEEAAKLEAKLEATRADIEKSGLVFTLQGMPFRMAQKVADIFNEEEPATGEQVKDLVEKTILEVHDSKGAKSSRPNRDMVDTFEERFSPAEFNKLLSGVLEVNFSAATYEAGVDAGFPGGSADVER